MAKSAKSKKTEEVVTPTPELKTDEAENKPQVYLPVVRNVQTNDFYTYLGENKFQNIRTKAEGEVPADKASTLFRINIDATKMFNEFPLVNDLVNKLNLTFDNNQKQ
jgi:hypothetical protein